MPGYEGLKAPQGSRLDVYRIRPCGVFYDDRISHHWVRCTLDQVSGWNFRTIRVASLRPRYQMASLTPAR